MTVDERKEIIATLFLHRYAYDGREVHSDDVLHMLDSLITDVQRQAETRCKEALVAQGEAWQQELSRQLASAMECGRAEGKEKELTALMADVLPHCAACMKAWSIGAKYTIDFSACEQKVKP